MSWSPTPSPHHISEPLTHSEEGPQVPGGPGLDLTSKQEGETRWRGWEGPSEQRHQGVYFSYSCNFSSFNLIQASDIF